MWLFCLVKVHLVKLLCFSYVAPVLEAEGVIALELREGFFLGHKMQPNADSLTSKSILVKLYLIF